MRYSRFLKLILITCLLLILPLSALADDTPWGRVRIRTGSEEFPESTRMFAPRAVITKGNYEGDLYLAYRYCRFNAWTRCWQLRIEDEDGQPYGYNGAVDVTFPYPTKWSEPSRSYWKWSREYAKRYDWYAVTGFSLFRYETLENGQCLAGYFVMDSSNADVEHEEISVSSEDPENNTTRIYASFLGDGYKGSKTHLTHEDFDDFGHQLTLYVNHGTFPSVAIRIDNGSVLDHCEVRAFLGTFGIWNVTQIVRFKGYMVDTRPKALKQSPHFWRFLRWSLSTIH